MNRRLAVLMGAASAVVLIISLLSLKIDLGETPIAKAIATGQALSPVGLTQNERIEIDYSDEGCRSWHNWSFVLFGGPEHRFAVIDTGGSYDVGESGREKPSAIGALFLSERDCRGLFDLLQLYRRPDPAYGSTTTVRITVSYFRGSEKIGTEEFVDHGMADYWVYERDHGGEVPVGAGVTHEMVSLREFVRRAADANEAEPIATSGTAAVFQAKAPATVVSNL